MRLGNLDSTLRLSRRSKHSPALLDGILFEDQGETYMADDTDDSDQARPLRPLHGGSCVYRIAFGPRAGQKVLTLQGALPRQASGKQKLCVNSQGFSLHAAVRFGAGQRKTLERLCRYITRRAPSR
jgi:Putative transposase